MADFYERRVRRILPALFAMLLATLAVAILALTPPDAAEVAASTLAAALSVSNFYFWLHSGYFDNPAGTMPLLHTWSLSVEEQYYLFFPALLLAWNRLRPGRFLELIAPIFVVSLAISAYGAVRHDASAFYLLHSRAWELMLGGIVALRLLAPPRLRWLREVMAAAGMIAMVLSVALYDDRMAFPGVAALAPCIGAALIIWTGQPPTLVGWGLSLRPVVFIGLISYSLYLWHWPVIVLQKISWLFYAGESRFAEKLILLALSFGLAIVSWRFVERPFRNKAWPAKRWTLFAGAAGVAAVIVVLAGVIMATDGLPGFLPQRATVYSAYLRYDPKPSLRTGTCMIDEDLSKPLAASCLKLDPDRPDVLVLGDSHAAHLWSGLKTAFPEVNFLQATGSSCPPTSEAMATYFTNCRQTLSRAVAFIREHHVESVVLAGHWARFGGDGGVAFAREIQSAGTRVVLFGPAPSYTRPLPRLLQLGVRTGQPDIGDQFLEPSIFDLDRRMAAAAAGAGIEYVSQLELLCNSDSCLKTVSGIPLQFDANHYTVGGSALLATRARRAGLRLPGQPDAIGAPIGLAVRPGEGR